ncbi:MAG TPA: pilus assembly protein N-terminal domain-containing protein [Planctomycetaceae bacterium]|nr:pilus assembly protein N-terminal domain-containing protein [Planctomycetaceae bacterium]
MRMFAQSSPKFFRMLFLFLAAAGFARAAVAAPDESAPLPIDNDPLVKIADPQSDLRLVEKFAKIIEIKNRISTVYGFDPEVVHVTKVDMHPNEIRVHALTPGVTSLVLVDEKNTSFTIEVFVIGDVRHLQAYLKNLFPSDAVTAIAVRDSVVLRGYVTRPEDIPRIMDIAKEFYPNVINQMEVGGDQEVELKVKVIEIDRTKLKELGFNFLGTTNFAFLGSLPGGLAPLSSLNIPIGAAPSLGVNPQNFAANPSLLGGVVNNNHTFAMFLDALQAESLLKILASPVLVTTNGQPANMLSGGEFPILVPQSLGTVTIQWKEFGVRLTAVPILLGNGRVRLNLQPEVSQKDFSNAVTTGGLTVPGLTTRRVNTSVEMRFGETFMLAGLTEVQDTAQTFKTPFLGELPYIGAAFRRVSYQTTETELVILVTPVLAGAMQENQVPPGGPGMFTDQPTDRELYWYGMLEVPSNGGVCPNCGPGGNHPNGYPPPIMDLDMGHNGPSPMITPVPVQELPPIHEQFSPVAPPAPAAPAGMQHGPQAQMMPPPPGMSQETIGVAPIAPMPAAPSGATSMSVGPYPQAGPSMNPMSVPSTGIQQNMQPAPAPPVPGSASRWSYNPAIRQVNAQSPTATPGGATQAVYSTSPAVSPASAPAPSTQSTGVRNGLYEPQSGLYVPTGGNP